MPLHVMLGLLPAFKSVFSSGRNVDGRDKPGHDPSLLVYPLSPSHLGRVIAKNVDHLHHDRVVTAIRNALLNRHLFLDIRPRFCYGDLWPLYPLSSQPGVGSGSSGDKDKAAFLSAPSTA
jgi:hypothetical protein